MNVLLEYRNGVTARFCAVYILTITINYQCRTIFVALSLSYCQQRRRHFRSVVLSAVVLSAFLPVADVTLQLYKHDTGTVI